MKTIDVVLAAPDLAGEPEIVAAWSRPDAQVQVVRRCVDAVDLLGAVASGCAHTAIVSPGLPRLGLETVARLTNVGTDVVGVVAQGDDRGERVLRDFRVPRVIVLPPGDLHERMTVLTRALRETSDSRVHAGVISAREAALHPGVPSRAEDLAPPESGRLVTVWGPHGAPGRTCVAIGLADEIARKGTHALLVDADSSAASVALWLGMLDEASGIAIACRQAEAGVLDVLTLAEAARAVTPHWRVITGLPRPDRWIELRATALDRMWQVCRALPGVTVIDVGAGIDPHADTVLDQRGPHRYTATHSALAASDEVIVVGSADPLGMDRLIHGLQALTHWQPAHIRVVVTRVRRSVVGRDPGGQIKDALHRHAGVEDVVLIDDDCPSYDRCLREGRTLAETAPRSVARAPLQALADDVIAALADPLARSAV
jgi:MinD-like ATPase involved in chromosome partitioning or flagellar assembly